MIETNNSLRVMRGCCESIWGIREGFFKEVIFTEQRFQGGQLEEYPGFREQQVRRPGEGWSTVNCVALALTVLCLDEVCQGDSYQEGSANLC